MQHIINANFGDTIVINIPTKPKVARRQIITIDPQTELATKHYQVVNDVCAALDITVQQLVSKSKAELLCAARFYIAYTLYHQNITQGAIAELLKRNRTTITYACATHADLLAIKDAKTLHLINTIQQYEATKN